MPTGSTTGTLRLVRPWRGQQPGSVIVASPAMAERLIAGGWASPVSDGTPAGRPQHERAVAVAAVETRGATP